MVFILGFSIRIRDWGLGHTGLDMTVLAIGTCMVIAAAAETRWRGPRALFPFLMFGRRSYEIYLTHMFVVFACFDLFVAAGKPIGAVPILFIVVVAAAGLLGELVARFYSEPLNRLLRARFREGRSELGAVIEARSAV
jgi:peptidoglycan/LPS O-acetylase OafA/YrhL